MHRQNLIKQIDSYAPSTDVEREMVVRFQKFIQQNTRCFERSLKEGHITGSAWLLNRGGDRVLMTHHKKLNKWLQLGGHADGESDILQVALREAQEESGILQVVPVRKEIFDIDIHRIPERPGEPEHFHYDVRYLVQVSGDGDQFKVSDESNSLKWVSKAELDNLNSDGLKLDRSVYRMAQKWSVG